MSRPSSLSATSKRHAWTALLPVAVASTGCGLSLAGELVPSADGPAQDAGAFDTPASGGSHPKTDAAGGSFDDGDGFGDAGQSAPPADGGGSRDGSDACDFAGSWATKLSIPVSWVPEGLMGVILNPGSGTIGQWILATRVQTGTTLTDTASVCGIALPDFQGTALAGSETYGVRFPDSLFDGVLPSFTIDGTTSGSTPGSTYATSPSVVLLGIDLASPATAPWPSSADAILDAVDSDHDGNPGVTALVAQGTGYSDIPVNISKSPRADKLYVVIRQVTQVNGTVADCDHISGSVSIPQLEDSSGDSKYAIDSHVVGCELEGDAGACDPTFQTNFLDSTQPIFSPSGGTTFASVRVPAGTTCAAVRQMFP